VKKRLLRVRIGGGGTRIPWGGETEEYKAKRPANSCGHRGGGCGLKHGDRLAEKISNPSLMKGQREKRIQKKKLVE